MDRLFESLFKYRFFLFREGDLAFDSPVSAWVIPTDEERMIALHTANLLEHRPSD